MSDSYTAFAEVYDTFMDNVPYEAWAEFISEYLKDSGVASGIILDLGCGTGSMTRLLRDKGFDMIGVDASEEMLQIAREAEFLSEEENLGILYLCQDMREFELYGTVQAIVSVCDSLNYITEPEDLLQVFRLANNYLEKQGLFIFDLNTPYKYRELLGDKTFAEDRESSAFIWDNYFDEESGINEYALTLFTELENGDFSRDLELHYERCYSLGEIKELLKKAGMEFVEAFADYDRKMPITDDVKAERMVIIAREQFQENKYYEDV